ncbi:hypothetical protein BJ508DRAFT_333045 [Ascobolus immersus RN42]|uniref:Uncharacterized protein n=1 Tax=Ascobolus immersus RN42 TaxID=1160509 RepID=A0A3N4HQZ9_ASCIM|nr:hypothetical protein BJ508DRAFT_333045 [Ascobolus immersus RN42]
MKRVEFELGLALIHLSVHSERIKGLRENRRERFPHSTADAWKEKNPTLPFRSFDRRWAMENGLVNGTLAKLVLLVVSLLRVKIEQSLSDCMANGTNDGWEIGNHEIAVEVLVLLLMDADKWQDLLAFLLTLRSESIEERIWRHLGAEDATVGETLTSSPLALQVQLVGTILRLWKRSLMDRKTLEERDSGDRIDRFSNGLVPLLSDFNRICEDCFGTMIFMMKVRSESIEARIWRHLYSTEENLGWPIGDEQLYPIESARRTESPSLSPLVSRWLGSFPAPGHLITLTIARLSFPQHSMQSMKPPSPRVDALTLLTRLDHRLQELLSSDSLRRHPALAYLSLQVDADIASAHNPGRRRLRRAAEAPRKCQHLNAAIKHLEDGRIIPHCRFPTDVYGTRLQALPDFIERSKKGLVREKLMNLIVNWLLLWRRDIGIAISLLQSWEKEEPGTDDSKPEESEDFFESARISRLRKMVAEDSSRRAALVAFLFEVRSESVEERIWRHVHAE